MCIALVGLVPPSELGIDAPVVFAAKLIFPGGFETLVVLAAFGAAWTTLNAVMAAMARDVYALAKGGVFPTSWASVNKFGAPYIGVIVVTVLGVIFTAFSLEIMKYVNVSSTYLLAVAIVIGVSSLYVRKKLPEQYEAAHYKLKGFWYYFWPVGMIVTSLFFLVIAIRDDPFMSMLSGILVPVGLLLYWFRKKQYEKTGQTIDDRIRESMKEEN
jgi:amino acid transporter